MSEMKKMLFYMAAGVVLSACQSSTVKIAGRFVGSNAKTVYLEQVTPYVQTAIDSASLNANGDYRFEVRDVDEQPSLYNIVYDGERIPLFLAGGDRLTVGAIGSVARNYTVEGSEESELLREFYQAYVGGVQGLDGILKQLDRPELSDDERRAVMREYTAAYHKLKREQLKFIVSNKPSLAAVYALYQRLPGETALFNGASDVVYYREVAEAVAERYPSSPYVQTLRREIERLESLFDLAANITESSYPEIELPDMYGKKVKLSSLSGKVILLEFWSAEAGNSNARNADLKRIHERLSPRGFEVYQVAVDTQKPVWINAVQQQALPWISVSDLHGTASAAARTYNVQKLPTNYLIDREGHIVAKDLYGEELERKVESLL